MGGHAKFEDQISRWARGLSPGDNRRTASYASNCRRWTALKCSAEPVASAAISLPKMSFGPMVSKTLTAAIKSNRDILK